jgi:nitric oxide reductase large subunit
MNKIRQVFGIVWVLLGLAAGYFLVFEQSFKLFQKGGMDNLVPAIIYSFILAPLLTGGMCVFGVYALQNEYKRID